MTYKIRYEKDEVENQKKIWREENEPKNLRKVSIHDVDREKEAFSVFLTYKYDHRYKGGKMKTQTGEKMVMLPSDAKNPVVVKGDVVKDRVKKPEKDIPEDYQELRQKVLEVGKEVEPRSEGLANDLSEDQINTIVATMDFFGLDRKILGQTVQDLTTYEYRVFDWMGMMMDTGQLSSETDSEYETRKWLFKNFAHIYLEKKDPDGFVQYLRSRDLQVNPPVERR